MTKRKPKHLHKKSGKPTTYKSIYAQMIVDFFDQPAYLVKDMTITKPDGSQIDKSEMEALPPLFLSDFAKSIGMPLLGYRTTLNAWAEKHPEFANALKEAKELEEQRIRTGAQMGVYAAAFSIFTMKNIAGWRDKTELSGDKDNPLQFQGVIVERAAEVAIVDGAKYFPNDNL